ncbi:MAG TPA: hypothetical protein VIK13_00915 [Candidatus Limnocylindrales bacterium]
MNGDARALEVVGISKRYGDLVALENLTFEVRAGELFELQTWSAILRATRTATPAEISQPKALLTLRLQQVDAWPYPSGEQLGTFGRALWTVWPRLVQQSPQRRCTWPECTTFLPVGAHGNRQHCDEHRREAPRLRSARQRQRARAG